MRILRAGLALVVAGYIALTGGCGTKTFAKLKDFNHYVTSAEKPGDGWYDFKQGAREFRQANSPKKVAEGLDNAGVGFVDFLMGKYEPFATPENVAPNSKRRVSVSEVEEVGVSTGREEVYSFR